MSVANKQGNKEARKQKMNETHLWLELNRLDGWIPPELLHTFANRPCVLGLVPARDHPGHLSARAAVGDCAQATNLGAHGLLEQDGRMGAGPGEGPGAGSRVWTRV